MKKLFLAAASVAALNILMFSLSGCAALPGIWDAITGQAREPATRTPLYVYRADLQLKVDGETFDGVGVTLAQSKTDIDVTSQIHLDRVEVETCGRQDVCQNGKPCSKNFDVSTGWFGDPGKHMVYHFTPSQIEKGEDCPIYIRVFDKQALAAWGFLAFRNQEDLPAHFICNGFQWKFAGHSVCQTKAGLIQRISFDQNVDDFEFDTGCGFKQIDLKTFELRPKLGLCTAKFYSNGHWHGLDLIAYDEVLVRGT